MMDLHKISDEFEYGWPWPSRSRSNIYPSKIFVSAIALKPLKCFCSNWTQWWTCIKSRTSSKMGDLDLHGQTFKHVINLFPKILIGTHLSFVAKGNRDKVFPQLLQVWLVLGCYVANGTIRHLVKIFFLGCRKNLFPPSGPAPLHALIYLAHPFLEQGMGTVWYLVTAITFEPFWTLSSNLKVIFFLWKSRTSSKTDDLDLDLQGHIGREMGKFSVLNFWKKKFALNFLITWLKHSLEGMLPLTKKLVTLT